MRVSQRVYFAIGNETLPAIEVTAFLGTEPDEIKVLPGQHRLLGWHLTHEQLGFLASIRCSIEADEYG
jgi:hypothetical protein